MSTNANEVKKYYSSLGLDQNARSKDITPAFEKKTAELKKEYEKKNAEAEDDAAKKAENEKAFDLKQRELQEAYAVLSDPAKKAEYDRNFTIETLNPFQEPNPASNKDKKKEGGKKDDEDKEDNMVQDAMEFAKALVGALSALPDKIKNTAGEAIDPVQKKINKRILTPLKEKASKEASALKDKAFSKLTSTVTSTKSAVEKFIEANFAKTQEQNKSPAPTEAPKPKAPEAESGITHRRLK